LDRYVCIHGHFYQPPRENPWFEAVEVQDSAYPYHDWNERITYECYAPNSASRVLDREGKVERFVNNYAATSFNFGPTLLAWLASNAPGVYEAVLRADRESMQRFGGHGSALAQCYSHMIMPLASERDRRTQVAWGIRDFESRFGRLPEGMWLPECAVDTPTLEALAERDIRFTVLAPGQARRVRPAGSATWQDVSGERVDPRRAYICRLPSGRSISLFFYDGAASRGVAFEGLLHSGESLAGRLLSGFAGDRPGPQLVHIATDGETYGHHHRHGDMALAYALRRIEESGAARLTVYAEFLERHPPVDEVEIVEGSSWSCRHGVERWRGDCGCRDGRHPQWRQGWRGPLRDALDWLRDEVAGPYEAEAEALLDDPWKARDDYIDVVLDRSDGRRERFLEEHRARGNGPAATIRALKLLELQRHAMLMYTSCGWFFEDVSGIETVQVIQYAGRVLQLAQELFGDGLEPEFLRRLERARSNVSEQSDGRTIFVNWVRPAEVSLEDVAAHYAISSLFESYGGRSPVYAFEVVREDLTSREIGEVRIAVGRARVTSRVTADSITASFAVLHLGDHNVSAGVREFPGEAPYRAMKEDVLAAFDLADFAEVTRRIDRHFGSSTYSLESLFRDERRKVLDQVLDAAVTTVEGVFATVYAREAPLMRFLVSLGSPLPGPFLTAAELYLNASLRRELAHDSELNPERLGSLAEEAERLGVPLDREGLGYRLAARVRAAMFELVDRPDDMGVLHEAERCIAIARASPFPVDLWEAQNSFSEITRSAYEAMRQAAGAGDEGAARWVEQFRALGRQLSMPVD
jgi:alpha-amylase/alpha-mannosidase (GH57 family)